MKEGECDSFARTRPQVRQTGFLYRLHINNGIISLYICTAIWTVFDYFFSLLVYSEMQIIEILRTRTLQ